jgi:hypothetical protein
MKNAPWILFTLLAASGAGSALAAGSDELWDMTMKVEMPGMNMQMPEMKHQFCQPKGNAFKPDSMPRQDKKCEMVDLKVSGNTTSWKMRCTGPEKMEGSGIMTRTADTLQGSTKMSMTSQGQTMQMNQAMSAKRVGTCDYAVEQKKLEDSIKAMQQKAPVAPVKPK